MLQIHKGTFTKKVRKNIDSYTSPFLVCAKMYKKECYKYIKSTLWFDSLYKKARTLWTSPNTLAKFRFEEELSMISELLCMTRGDYALCKIEIYFSVEIYYNVVTATIKFLLYKQTQSRHLKKEKKITSLMLWM